MCKCVRGSLTADSCACCIFPHLPLRLLPGHHHPAYARRFCVLCLLLLDDSGACGHHPAMVIAHFTVTFVVWQIVIVVYEFVIVIGFVVTIVVLFDDASVNCVNIWQSPLWHSRHFDKQIKVKLSNFLCSWGWEDYNAWERFGRKKNYLNTSLYRVRM